MTANEKQISLNISSYTQNPQQTGSEPPPKKNAGQRIYDPEMLYVECHACGKPVLWEKGKTTELLLAAGVEVSNLDERCMIVSEGCPSCAPQEREGYTLAVIRLAGLTPEEAAYMARPAGNA